MGSLDSTTLRRFPSLITLMLMDWGACSGRLFIPSGPDASVDAPLLQDGRGPLLDGEEGFVFFSERTRFCEMPLPGFQGKGLLKFQREMEGVRLPNLRYTWHGNSPIFFADRALSKSLETFPCRAPGIPSIGPDAICPWVAPSRA